MLFYIRCCVERDTINKHYCVLTKNEIMDDKGNLSDFILKTVLQVFMDIVNVSLPNTTVPACLKTATIIPLPMQSNITSLNNYRPAALISIIFKCFENLVLEHLKSTLLSL